jgi:hypothetical protein
LAQPFGGVTAPKLTSLIKENRPILNRLVLLQKTYLILSSQPVQKICSFTMYDWRDDVHTTPIFSDGLTVKDKHRRAGGRSGAYWTTKSCTTNSPWLDGQYAGGLLFSIIAGASCGTSRYSTIRSTELKSSSSWAATLQTQCQMCDLRYKTAGNKLDQLSRGLCKNTRLDNDNSCRTVCDSFPQSK